jgi:hypothetical protein
MTQDTPMVDPLVFPTGTPMQNTSRASAGNPPTLHHLVPSDLQQTDRLLTLFDQAQEQGLLQGSASERLAFVALAEHARALGRLNPCGLFAHLLRHQLWHYATARDEAAAVARLRAYDGATAPMGVPLPPPEAAPPPPLALSKDAFTVRYLHAQGVQAGFHGNLFPLVYAEDPTWTRDRWEAAVRELAVAQQTWQHANVRARVEALQPPGDLRQAWGEDDLEDDLEDEDTAA